jgi:plastocyanin
MNKKILIGLVIVIALVVGIYYFSQKTVVAPTNINTNVAPGAINVAIENFVFAPAELNIKKGDTVIWTNNDSAPHQVWGDGLQGDVLGKGQNSSFTFNTAGVFDYICKIHQSMKGKINVL